MIKHLTEQERQLLDKRVAEAEQRTGCQVVLAVIARSDVYAEIPWKAFALGAAAAGLAVFVWDVLQPVWITWATVLIAVTTIMAAGAACALASIHLSAVARFFLDRNRAEVEVLQYAQSLFLSRELFATSGRTGILLLVSLFERRVALLPDKGVEKRLNSEAQQAIITEMSGPLAEGRVAAAMDRGLMGLEKALAGTAPKTPGKDELPNQIVEEKGV
ncbi:MAG: TPM domain-containing protein [Nitrospiraceae bacterium]|nr:TPM domain-containing protein [Nitrospiraceae bacterium]